MMLRVLWTWRRGLELYASFEETCELIGRTRAIADPGRVLGTHLEFKWNDVIGKT